MAQSKAERERVERHLTRQHVDGVLLLSLHGDDPLPRRLAQRGLPTVLGGPARRAGSRLSYVDADNGGGARRGGRAPAGERPPADRHHRRPAGHGRRPSTAWPATGDALRAAGLPVDDSAGRPGDFSEASGAAAMRALLDRAARPRRGVRRLRPDGGAGAMRVAARAAAAGCPSDVAVVGFDDSVLARHTEPPLTTVHQPVEEMGREMARLLLAKIAGEASRRRVVLDTQLVVRASA